MKMWIFIIIFTYYIIFINLKTQGQRYFHRKVILFVLFQWINSEEKAQSLFHCTSLTHTCVASGERWLGDRCRAGTPHRGSRRPPRPDWPRAGLPPGLAWLRWQLGRARRWRPRPRPSGQCRHGTHAGPCPEPGLDLRRQNFTFSTTKMFHMSLWLWWHWITQSWCVFSDKIKYIEPTNFMFGVKRLLFSK